MGSGELGLTVSDGVRLEGDSDRDFWVALQLARNCLDVGFVTGFAYAILLAPV